jgi:hypothetical protein
MTTGADDRAALLRLAANLAGTHREHEKHYGVAPLRTAETLLEHSLTLKALAERWRVAEPAATPLRSPFAGAEDLNDARAIETSGVLFLESGETPPEIESLRDDLERLAAAAASTGEYLANAMDASWQMAAALVTFPDLDDVLVERHAIIARDAQAASLLTWEARQLRRARHVLGQIDFGAGAIRSDLAGPRRLPSLLFAAAELIDAAVETALESARLVRGNERSWRLFKDRVDQLARASSSGPDASSART